MFVYLDNSATTKQYENVTEKMIQYMREDFGNPSSMYRLGITAEKAVKEARRHVGVALGVPENNIYFTSGGTEADNFAIFGSILKNKRLGNKIITSKIEHPAVLEPMKRLEEMGFEVIYLPVDKNCRVDIETYKNALSDNVIFISIMTANNEIGTLQPIEEMYKLKPKNAFFHTDAVQAFGKVNVPRVDLISISGHKIHGPKGIGALFVSDGTKIKPHMLGGGQERNMRSGTENVPAIVGFGEAAKTIASGDENISNMKKVKEYLQEGILAEIDDIKINTPKDSVSSILSISFLGTKSEVILHKLEEDDIFVSAGSACSSNKKGRSHVLSAMNMTDEEIEGTLRFSFSSQNTTDEMDYVIERLKKAVTDFRKLMHRR